MKTFLICLGVLLMVLVGAGSFYIFRQQAEQAAQKPLHETTTIHPQSIVVTIPQAKTQTNLKMGGNSYRDPQERFVFLYPNDYAVDAQNNGQYVRISKNGKTQQGATELYDGVNMVFEGIDLHGQPLDAWLTDLIRNATTEQSMEVVDAKKRFELNGYTGFTYTLRGLGTFTYYVLQKNAQSNSAVFITTAVSDPTGAGFQEEVHAILASLEILK